MSRLWIAVIATAVAALGFAPAAAQATVTSSTITSWVSSQPGTPKNDPYLIYYDNPPATALTVSGTATATSPTDTVDIVCFYGSTALKLAPAVPVHSGIFTTPAFTFQTLAGHACRLRAVPTHTSAESAAFTGPQVAVSEAKSVAIASGPNAGKPFAFYLNGTTFTGFAAWSSAGTASPNAINPNACGGPNLAAIDSSLSIGNPALDCVGSLLSDDSGAWGGRSEVQIDGRNAYDAASAQALFGPAGGNPPSQSLAGFPTLSTSADWDPGTGLVSSSSRESWVSCNGPNAEKPTFATCPSFTSTGVQLERGISTTEGGRVVTMTDTWSSTDHAAHTLDLLYDNNIGLVMNSAERGYEFPGQSGFSAHLGGDSLPGPSAAPGSIFVRTNLGASDGNPAEAVGAITFSRAPSGFQFAPAPVPPASPAPSNEFEQRQILQVPAGGSASLSYIYSTGYSVAEVQSLALAAQDRFQAPAIAITSPASGTTVSTPTVSMTGTATAGSGIKSLVVGGQTVPVGSGGAWSADVPLSQGSNTITALATDGAGAVVQSQVTVVYQPPPPPPPPPPTRCKVPRTKNMKLAAAERALRHARCRVGRIKRLRSRTVHRGRVMNTSPRAGRTVPDGSKVELFVSNGH